MIVQWRGGGTKQGSFLCALVKPQEMLGELFTPIETPEAQNRGFLKGFFGGNANTFDREELCKPFLLFFHYWGYFGIKTISQINVDTLQGR